MSEPSIGDHACPTAADYPNRQHTPLPSAPVPRSAPISQRSSSKHQYASKVSSRLDAMLNLAEETRGLFLGPMPPESFLDNFLPLSGGKVKAEIDNPFKGVANKKNEMDMYPTFIACANTLTSEFVILNTHVHRDAQRDSMAPDIIMYPRTSQPPKKNPTDFTKMEVYMEFKDNISQDPFIDPEEKQANESSKGNKLETAIDNPTESVANKNNEKYVLPTFTAPAPVFRAMEANIEPEADIAKDPVIDSEETFTDDLPKDTIFEFERDSNGGREIRGQITSNSAALAGSQWRVHMFCVLIFGECARLIRWDRSGAIVTRRFNYVNEPYLAEFFLRYEQLTPRQRGHDTSVTLASKNEIIEMGPIHGKHLSERNRYHQSFRKISMKGYDNGDQPHQFIISCPPHYYMRTPFGRATRPMNAYHIGSKKIVFLKDYWRTNGEGMEKEGDIYRHLEACGVPNIAPFGGADDVLDHATITPNFRAEPWACPSEEMTSFHQYRLYLKVVARPLTEFNSSHEFVSAIADAMKAHRDAYFDARILHRDISVGNIMIAKNNGILIDWDLCTRVPDQENRESAKQSNNEVVGTRQFMSARLLKRTKAPNTREDDLESCLHVLTWVALRWTVVCAPKSKINYLLSSFDRSDYAGVEMKRYILKFGEIAETVEFTDRQALNNLIKELTDTLAVRYQSEPTPDEKEAYKWAKDTIPAELWDAFIVHKYHRRKNNLASRDWLVDTFQRHLSDDSAWRTKDDKPTPWKPGPEPSKKRMRDEEQLTSRAPLQKILKVAHILSNNSSVHVEDDAPQIVL